jgi:hypothetical protein
MLHWAQETGPFPKERNRMAHVYEVPELFTVGAIEAVVLNAKDDVDTSDSHLSRTIVSVLDVD